MTLYHGFTVEEKLTASEFKDVLSKTLRDQISAQFNEDEDKDALLDLAELCVCHRAHTDGDLVRGGSNWGYVRMESYGIKDSVIKYVKKLLQIPYFKYVDQLNLCDNPITNAGAIILKDLEIKTLYMKDTLLDAKGISDLIINNKSLIWVYFDSKLVEEMENDNLIRFSLKENGIIQGSNYNGCYLYRDFAMARKMKEAMSKYS